jgi:hypothetical protein
MMNIDIKKIERRVRDLSDSQLLQWLGVAIPGMQRHLEAYENTGVIDHLGELLIAETSAGMVVAELVRRNFPSAQEEPPPAVSAPSESSADADTTSAPKRFKRARRGRRGPVLAT